MSRTDNCPFVQASGVKEQAAESAISALSSRIRTAFLFIVKIDKMAPLFT